VLQFIAGLGEIEQFEAKEFVALGDTVVVILFEGVRSVLTGRMVNNEYTRKFTN
jgi:hypothetical protein